MLSTNHGRLMLLTSSLTDNQQFLATGMMPDVSTIGNGTIGTNMIFGNKSAINGNNQNQNSKRSIELLDDDWASPAAAAGAESVGGVIDDAPGSGSGSGDMGGREGGNVMVATTEGRLGTAAASGSGRQSKKAKTTTQ